MGKIYVAEWQVNRDEFDFVYDFTIGPPKEIVSRIEYYVWQDKDHIISMAIAVFIDTDEQFKQLQSITGLSSLVWKEIGNLEEYEESLCKNYSTELHIPDHNLLLIMLGNSTHLNIYRLEEREERLKNQENYPDDLQN